MKKRIGIVGGLSPESTVSYYLYITRKYVERFGDYSYPEIVILSVDLEKYHAWRKDNRWDFIAADLIASVNRLIDAGAEIGLIATNTMHKVFAEVANSVAIPLINVIDETALKCRELKLNTLGLLGTRYTMRDGFYQTRLAQFNVDAIVPTLEQQETIHRVIVTELIRGHISEKSKVEYLCIVEDLIHRGAQGVILGCTEIPLLINQNDVDVPIFDTAIIHAEAALQAAIS